MKLYKKGNKESYTLGVFPTIELLINQPDKVKRVVVHSKIIDNKGYPKIQELCEKHHIPIDIHDATIDKLSPKSNCFAIGIFEIYEDHCENENHVVLVNPMDMGNLGTIIRTMIGFDYTNLIIVGNSCDIYNPKVIRASMGAFFHIHYEKYEDFNEYIKKYPNHEIYPFMLKGAKNIHEVESKTKHSLIFGNESSGLDDSYLNVGQSVFIPHSHLIDSLNLSQSIGIGLYHFSKDKFKDKKVL